MQKQFLIHRFIAHTIKSLQIADNVFNGLGPGREFNPLVPA